ncbi:hypothetical protein P3S68_021231 [Capsicum galapagoense]
MKNFIVVSNKSKVKTNDHKIKLMFIHRTNIQKIVDSCFDRTLFKFRPFEHLINQVDIDETKLFDVIGEIVAYGPVQEYKQGDKSCAFMNV